MNEIHLKFSDKFRSQWIKVKFYKEKPKLEGVKRLEGVRFCEATKEAIIHPVFLDRESIICPGAQYAFGWRPENKNEFLKSCHEKRRTQKVILKSLLSRIPSFNGSFNYIGLNTVGEPDLVMSYVVPEEIMRLINIYHRHQGKHLDVSFCSMMSICAGIAVKTYLDKDISLSFGCDDSRKYASLRRENLAISIPSKLFKAFLD